MKLLSVILFLFIPFALPAQKQGQSLLDSFLKELPKAKEDTNKVTTLTNISDKYAKIDPAEGIKYGMKGLQLAEKLKWQKGISTSCRSIGHNYTNESDYAKALEYCFRALKINEALSDTDAIAKDMNVISAIYKHEENYNKSLEYGFRSLSLFSKLGNKRSVGNQLGNIGSTYLDMNNAPLSIDYDFKALRILEELNDTEGIARNLGNIGECYTNHGDYLVALQFLFVSQKFAQSINYKRGMAFNIGNMGICYLGIANNIGGMKLQTDTGISPQQCRSLIINTKEILNSVLLRDSAAYHQKAIELLEKSMALAKEINASYVFVRYANKLSHAFAAEGEYKLAYETLQQYSTIKDSVYSSGSKIKIANMETAHDLEQKELEIKILNLNAHHEKVKRRLLTGGIGMTILLAFVVVMFFVRKQQSEKSIANEKINTLLKEQELISVSNMLEGQENERKRIATDLHDRLGSMLSTVKYYFSSMDEQIDNIKEINKEQYNKANLLLDEACDEVRKISHNLASGDLAKFGLAPALRQLKSSIEDAGKLKIDLLFFGMENRLDNTVEIAVYRVIQELLNNILKHSKATIINIQLTKADNALNVVVEDNGVGFDIFVAKEKGGLGLKNIETRVHKLGGSVSFDSGKGNGTTTIFDIPV